MKTTIPWILSALLAVALVMVGVHELVVLFGAGLLLALIKGLRVRSGSTPAALVWSGLPLANVAAAGAAGTPFGLCPLFFFFLKVGSVLFGSGYVLLAFLRADLGGRLRAD